MNRISIMLNENADDIKADDWLIIRDFFAQAAHNADSRLPDEMRMKRPAPAPKDVIIDHREETKID